MTTTTNYNYMHTTTVPRQYYWCRYYGCNNELRLKVVMLLLLR